MPVQTWRTVPLRQVVQVSVGLSATRRKPDGTGQLVPLVSVGDLRDGAVPPLAALPVAEVGVSPDSFRIQAGDVLLTARGTQIKAALVGPESEGAVANATLMIIRPGPLLHPAVLYAIVRGEAFHEALARVTRGSTTTLGLSRRDVEQISIPVPPLAEQAEVVTVLSTAERHYRLALEAAERRQRLLEVATERWLYHGPARAGAFRDG